MGLVPVYCWAADDLHETRLCRDFFYLVMIGFGRTLKFSQSLM